MKILSVVAQPSISHGCSSHKTFWDGKFTLVNMKNVGHHSVRKHREIKNGEKYITLGIFLNFAILNRIEITSL